MKSQRQGAIRRRIRDRGKRFVRGAVAEVLPDLLGETPISGPSASQPPSMGAAVSAPSISARHLPLATDKDQFWSLPATDSSGFDEAAIPPRELWQIEDHFLESGREHMDSMISILARHGLELGAAGGILDFGSGAGRLTRWMADVADDQQVWGVDVDVAAIQWAQQHLSPPLNFSTCTTAPHLPFEDRSFGLVIAGSVFTHIDNLADSWLLELRRVTRPGGILYLTVHDQVTVQRYLSEMPDYWLSKRMASRPDLFERLGPDHAAIGDRESANTFYDVEYLRKLWGQWLEVLEVAEGAYYNQTAMVLRRRDD